MFHRVLVTERPDARAERTRSLAFAGVMHIAVIVAVLVGSMLAVEAVKDEIKADLTFSFFELPKPPELELAPKPAPKKYEMAEVKPPEPEPVAPVPPVPDEQRVEFKPEMPEPEIEIPKNVLERQKLALASQELATGLRKNIDAPDTYDAATPRTAARPTVALKANGRGTADPLTAMMDAPEVKVPGGGRGGPGLPARAPGIQVAAGGGGGSMVAYKSSEPATFTDFTIPAPGPRGRAGGRPGGAPAGLITIPGDGVGGGAGSGGRGLKYGSGPADAPGGDVGSFALGGRPGGGPRGGTRIDGVRAALASKYGLPLVSVNELGQRSTEAARWNMLLPQLSDLLRKALHQGVASGGGDVVAVEVDGNNLILRYRDGIVHVLVPTDGGLAALFVARGAGARPVVSKVQEAESALNALARLTRGAS
jgi:hypothetical protein